MFINKLEKEEVELQLQFIDNVIMEYNLNEFEIKICEVKKDILLAKLEDIIIKNKIHNTETNHYYPELTNPNFNNIINNKKEFQKYNLKNTQGKQKPKKLIEFIKSPTQKLLANYINTKTPYNGLLIWHSVGVGKTCTAISIAENFRDLALQSKQKILILTPGQKLKQSWLKEIFNSDRQNKVKLSSNVNVQCTEDYYTKKYKQLRKNIIQLNHNVKLKN